MTNEEYNYLFKLCSPYEIIVITWYGKLRRLKCPFTVKVRDDVGTLFTGQYVKVSKVTLSTNNKTVFIIDEKPYYYWNFDIMTHL